MRRLRIGEQPTTGPNGVTPPDTPRPGAHSRRAAPQSGSTRVPQDRACPARLALSGTHGRWWHRPVGSHVSTFLHPFARRALPRFLATMGVLTPGRLSSPPRSPCFTWLAFRPFRLQPPSGCRLSFCTRPLSSTARLPRASGRLWLRSWLAGSPPFQAESSSSSYGLVVHLLQLSTSPHGDAVAVGFRPERVCLEGTCTPLTTTLAGALAGGVSRRIAGDRVPSPEGAKGQGVSAAPSGLGLFDPPFRRLTPPAKSYRSFGTGHRGEKCGLRAWNARSALRRGGR